MLPTLEEIASWTKEAGEILREGFGQKHEVTHKSAIDLVTEMDRRSEDFLLGKIRQNFSGHSILSEESGSFAGDEESQWYVDPLDGTINYSHDIPIYCVSVAYSYKGELTLAAISNPMVDEHFTAERGKGVWLNGKPIHVSQTEDLMNSLLVTGFPYDVQTTPRNNLDHFGYFTRRSQGVRRFGSAAIDLCYVAAGRFDGYWELGIKPWDIAAGILMVEEAGGKVSDLAGGRDYFKPPFALVAANPPMHAKLLSELVASDKLTLKGKQRNKK
jgi:myo-inositol-1(or 4)-monophosphatase